MINSCCPCQNCCVHVYGQARSQGIDKDKIDLSCYPWIRRPAVFLEKKYAWDKLPLQIYGRNYVAKIGGLSTHWWCKYVSGHWIVISSGCGFSPKIYHNPQGRQGAAFAKQSVPLLRMTWQLITFRFEHNDQHFADTILIVPFHNDFPLAVSNLNKLNWLIQYNNQLTNIAAIQNKFDPSKFAGAYYWHVEMPHRGYMEHGSKDLAFMLNKANLRDLIAATGLVISNWIQIVNFPARVTVKFDGWPWKTIGHFFYTLSRFVHHFKYIGEFILDLQSRNAQLGRNWWYVIPCDLEIWWMTLGNNRAPLLCYFKLCASFLSHWWIQNWVTVRKRPIWVKFDDF